MTKLINPALPATAIVSATVCPIGSLLGYDADECRANQLNDGRIVSGLNGVSRPVDREVLAQALALPYDIRKVVAALMADSGVNADPYRLVNVSTGEGVGAVAQGFGPDDIMTSVLLAKGEYGDVRVSLSFTGNDLKSMGALGLNFGRDYDRATLTGRIPDAVDAAAKQLVAAGFRLTGENLDGMKACLIFVNGRRIPNTQSILGVRAEVTWEF